MVDIIIPAYNAHDTIYRCVSSILSQTKLHLIKVTIADDCSEKDYSEVVEKFKDLVDIQCIRLHENGGPGVARQFGIDNTNNPYMMFIDADDILINSFAVEKMLYEMENDKNIYITLSTFLEELPNGNFYPHVADFVWMFGKMYRRSYLDSNKIRFNLTRANEDGGFHTKMRVCAKKTDIVKVLDESTYVWKVKENSITRINNGEYGYNKGFEGYVENKIEALKFNPDNKEFVFENSLYCFHECYKNYIHAYKFRPEYISLNFDQSSIFWEEVVKEQYNSNIDLAQKILVRAALESPVETLPHITILDFINKLNQKVLK